MYVFIEPSVLVENIKKACALRKISIYAVENALEYQKGVISKKWRKSKPSWDKVLNVARFLDVSVDFLVGNTTNIDSHKIIENDEAVPE